MSRIEGSNVDAGVSASGTAGTVAASCSSLVGKQSNVQSPREISMFSPRPALWRQGTPSRMTDRDMAKHLCPASHRLTPRELSVARRKWEDKVMADWITTHALDLSAMRKDKISPEREDAIRQAFELMDTNNSGKIDLQELSIAMKALGFRGHDIRDAVISRDGDRDGQLDYGEFLVLVVNATLKSDPGTGADSFPFELIANSYRITRLIDSYVPSVRDGCNASFGAGVAASARLRLKQRRRSSCQSVADAQLAAERNLSTDQPSSRRRADARPLRVAGHVTQVATEALNQRPQTSNHPLRPVAKSLRRPHGVDDRPATSGTVGASSGKFPPNKSVRPIASPRRLPALSDR